MDMADLKLEKIDDTVCAPSMYWTSGEVLPCSDALIALVAEQWRSEKHRPPFQTDVLRLEFEKPRFVHAPDVHFSVSHSGSCWICAIDNQPVGIDLQRFQTVNAAGIARRHFHPMESLWLEAHPDDFFKIWTAKEAFVKYTGKGIDNDFGSFSVVDLRGFKAKINDACLRFVPFLPGYVLAIASTHMDF